MILAQFIMLFLWLGMSLGHISVESGVELFSVDGLWQDYEHDNDFFIPENVMVGIMFVISKFILVGYTISEWVYPYGLVLSTILLVISIIRFEWFLYPFLFVYVLHEERKKQ